MNFTVSISSARAYSPASNSAMDTKPKSLQDVLSAAEKDGRKYYPFRTVLLRWFSHQYSAAPASGCRIDQPELGGRSASPNAESGVA